MRAALVIAGMQADCRRNENEDGPVTVVWGGDRLAVNDHARFPAQRWAYDLSMEHNDYHCHEPSATPSDVFCYGVRVLSPAAGRVVVVTDSEPDNPVGRRVVGAIPPGNHVGIEVAPGESLFLGHLQPGSIDVRPGDRVSVGQLIGRVGNSGFSTAPHLHIHLQDTADSSWGDGIPLLFSDYVDGGHLIARGMPEGGVHRHTVIAR